MFRIFVIAFACFSGFSAQAQGARWDLAPSSTDCPHGAAAYRQQNRVKVHGSWRVTREVSVFRLAGGNASFYESGLAIDADGAPNAYNRNNTGLDDIKGSAGWPTSCSVLVCLGHNPDGSNLYATIPDGPFEGNFVSSTSLQDRRTGDAGKPLHGKSDFQRYVDASTVPYIAIAGPAIVPLGLMPKSRKPREPGELAFVVNLSNGHSSPAIFADVGTPNTLGEGSIALAKALDDRPCASNPRTGCISKGILTIVFPGSESAPPWPVDRQHIGDKGAALFEAWGGWKRVKSCFPDAKTP